MFWSDWGTPLLNALLDAEVEPVAGVTWEEDLSMSHDLEQGYKHKDEHIVHLYTECPEGRLIAIAKRDAISTSGQSAMEGLEFCRWCLKQLQMDNPRSLAEP